MLERIFEVFAPEEAILNKHGHVVGSSGHESNDDE